MIHAVALLFISFTVGEKHEERERDLKYCNARPDQPWMFSLSKYLWKGQNKVYIL